MENGWNPWHGCHKISPGCKNCYVYRIDECHGRDDSMEVRKTRSFDLPVKKKRDGSWKIVPGTEIYTCFTSDFLVEEARRCGVTGARIMGGGFGGCTINLVKDDLYDKFIETVKAKFNEKYGHEPVIYPVVISDGAHKCED